MYPVATEMGVCMTNSELVDSQRLRIDYGENEVIEINDNEVNEIRRMAFQSFAVPCRTMQECKYFIHPYLREYSDMEIVS